MKIEEEEEGEEEEEEEEEEEGCYLRLEKCERVQTYLTRQSPNAVARLLLKPPVTGQHPGLPIPAFLPSAG